MALKNSDATTQYKHSNKLRFGVCLIMRDEESNLRRCLEPVREHVDSYCIVDTGSTDGSIALVREIMEGIPGEVYERPWVGFGHNRSEALELARSYMDFCAMYDCDDGLTIKGKLPLDMWEKAAFDCIPVLVTHGALTHERPHVFRLASNWEYRSDLHEFAALKFGRRARQPGRVSPQLSLIARTEGVRSKDPFKYQNDAIKLQRKIDEDLDPDLRQRDQFYLAQSHLHAGQHDDARINYQKRLAMTGGYEEERFISTQELVGLTNNDPELQTQYMFKALELAPHRLEAATAYLKHRRARGAECDQRTFAIGKLASLLVSDRSIPVGALFTLPHVYHFDFDHEFSLTATDAGYLEDAVASAEHTTKCTTVGANERQFFQNNLANTQRALAASDLIL